jgi:hypothetical protein
MVVLEDLYLLACFHTPQDLRGVVTEIAGGDGSHR